MLHIPLDAAPGLTATMVLSICALDIVHTLVCFMQDESVVAKPSSSGML